MDSYEKIKHLEMIERVIERMASNSFKLKEWAVALTTLIGTLSYKSPDKWYAFVFLGTVPLLSFWLLDSYYLKLEREYRVLYKNVVNNELGMEYVLDTGKAIYSKDDAKRICYLKCIFSKTEWCFYLALFIGFQLVLLFLNSNILSSNH